MEAKTQKTLHSFFDKFELRSFDRGETIIHPRGNKIFFLTNGVVKMFSPSKNNGELTLNIYKSHAVFPMCLVFDIQNQYLYASLTETRGYFAPKKDFKQFINKNPTVLSDLLKRIYLGLDGYFMFLEALLSGDAYYRVLTQLIIHTRRFGREKEGLVTFDWHLTHQQLASQTGLARESVTKEIKKLQDKNLIGYSRKKLFIYNLSKLEEECFLNIK